MEFKGKIMKSKLYFMYIFLATLVAQNVFAAREVKVMPVGNSITYGVVNSQDPLPGQAGYRLPLFEKLNNDANIEDSFVFVGDDNGGDPTVPNGWFLDGAHIYDFVINDASDDSAYGDITVELNQHQPNVVILHIGTNDIGTNRLLGDYSTNNTMIRDLYTMVSRIVSHDSIEHLFLCRVIPKLNTPGNEEATRDYNNAIERMLDESDLAGNAKINLIDMHTPFDVNRDNWISADNIHPTTVGYNNMSEFMYQYMRPKYVEQIVDNFNRAALGADWAFDPAIIGITDLDGGSANGDALSILIADTADTDEWNNLAVWERSENFTNIKVVIHEDAQFSQIWGFGICVGLDATATTANGYMVFQHPVQERYDLYTVVGGQAGDYITSVVAPTYLPGDSISVFFKQGSGSDPNIITISIGSDEYVLTDEEPSVGKANTFYSGILFNSFEYADSTFIDRIVATPDLPDNFAPAAPYNLDFSGVTNSTVIVSWTAPGNDGFGSGAASAYDLRYSTTPIDDDDDFARAKIVTGLDAPSNPGTSEQVSVTGLIPGTTYYFRLKAIDSWNNISEMSGQITVRTNLANMVEKTFDYPIITSRDTTDLEDEWYINTDQYELIEVAGSGDNQIVSNTNAPGDWNQPVIFKERPNATIVKMVWGNNSAGNPTDDGVGHSGLALMLNSPDQSASGYLIWIHNDWLPIKVRLYELQNGAPVGDELDFETYILDELPGSNDTLTVVMDWENANGIKFDVFVNSERATSAALWDDEKLHNPSTRYSGIMFNGSYAGEHNVTSFIVSADPDLPAGIEVVSAPDSAAVGSTPDEKIQIQVLDTNDAPSVGVPLWFDVESPDDAVILDEENISLFDPVHIEAEWDINPEGTYGEIQDNNASGGAYMVSYSGDASLSYTFHIKKDTTYYFWVRTYTTGFENMTFSIELDGNSEWTSDSWQSDDTPGWMWKPVNNKGNGEDYTPVSTRLRPGSHTLKIIKAHDDLPIDKVIITSDQFSGSWIEDSEISPMMSDDEGFAEVSVQLSKTAGPNIIKAYALGVADPATITIYGKADVPDSIAKTIVTDNQVGGARDTSDIPLEVTVFDQHGNSIPYVNVRFKSVKGDCKIFTPQVQTDMDGKASTIFAFGEQDSIHQITASLPQYPLIPADTFTVRTVTGRVKDVISKTGKYAGEKHYVNMVLDSFLVAQIVNDNGNGVNNTPVTFRVVQGDAEVGGTQPKYTQRVRGRDGIVSDTLFIGSTSSVIKVIADAGLAKDTIVIDSSYYRATVMQYISGDKSKVKVGNTLDDKIKVRVYNNPDPYNQEFAQNFPVTFRITDSRYGFKFSNDKETITVLTNPSTGTASVDVIPGPIHGFYEDIIEAVATDGFYPIDIQGFDGTYSIYIKSDAQALEIVSGFDAEGVVLSELEDSLKVRMVYPDPVNGQIKPVVHQPVTFTRLSSNGHFTGYTFATAELIVLTDDDGYAWVQYTLGSTAGTYSDSIMVSATNGEQALYNSPYIFRLSAKSTDADSIAPFSDIELKGIAGRPIAEKVEVQILDHFGNGVAGEEVVFRVLEGSGSLEGSADTVKTAVSEGAGGLASISWTLGTQAGYLNNKMEAIATNGIDTLSGSPIYFWATVEADSVSEVRSIIETDTTRYKASGRDTCWVTITLFDKYGNPVAGKDVEIMVDGTGNNYDHDPTEPTDTLGQTIGYFLSTASGEKIIRARDKTDNLMLDDQTKVMFESDIATKLSRVSVERPSANVGTVLNDPLTIEVLDGNNNPVPNKSVSFTVVGDNGSIVEPQPVLSDSDGVAEVHLLLGENADQVIVEVSSASLIGDKVYFIAQAKNKPAVAIGYANELYNVTGPAGQVLEEPFSVVVLDEDNDPVSGVDVAYSVERGLGTIESVYPSDEYGHAKAYFRTGSVVDGNYSEVKASANLAGSPLHFYATSIAGEADKLMAVSDLQQDKLVDENTILLVKVVDEYDNPVQYVDVRFEIAKGDAQIIGDAVVQSDKYGEAVVNLNVGHSTGRLEILAVNATLKDSPVKFYIDVTTSSSMADRIKIYPVPESGDTTYVGTIDSYLTDSLYVQVVDKYDNPVSGVVVRFEVESGTGQIVGNEFWVGSQKNGVAAIRFKTGTSPAQSVVKASWQPSRNVVRFNIESVNNPRSPVLKKGPPYYDRTINITEMDQADYLQVAMVADNRDPGESLLFQAFDANGQYPLQGPDGMVIQKQSVNTANLEWIPSFDQAGTYKMVLRVVDGQGGSDSDTIQVNVANKDQPPVVHNHYIPDGDTTIVSNMTLHFWVDVRDPDDDPITYHWYVDNKKVESSTSEFIYTVDDPFVGFQTVSVYAIAGDAATSYTWDVNVMVYVKMTNMLAQFDKFRREVTLSWQTSHEVNNHGFDIYRSYSEFGNYQKINEERIPGSSNADYSFIDTNVKAGVLYYYKIVDYDASGKSYEHGPVTMSIPVPKEFMLSQNYPNPFNPSTRVQYELPEQEHVKIHIYNMLGQLVTTLIDDVQEAGYYELVWNGRNQSGLDVATGIYLYRLQSSSKCITKRMVKIK